MTPLLHSRAPRGGAGGCGDGTDNAISGCDVRGPCRAPLARSLGRTRASSPPKRRIHQRRRTCVWPNLRAPGGGGATGGLRSRRDGPTTIQKAIAPSQTARQIGTTPTELRHSRLPRRLSAIARGFEIAGREIIHRFCGAKDRAGILREMGVGRSVCRRSHDHLLARSSGMLGAGARPARTSRAPFLRHRRNLEGWPNCGPTLDRTLAPTLTRTLDTNTGTNTGHPPN
jgi:hypothetical protein